MPLRMETWHTPIVGEMGLPGQLVARNPKSVCHPKKRGQRESLLPGMGLVGEKVSGQETPDHPHDRACPHLSSPVRTTRRDPKQSGNAAQIREHPRT